MKGRKKTKRKVGSTSSITQSVHWPLVHGTYIKMATGDDLPPSSVGVPEAHYNNNDHNHSTTREINGTAVAGTSATSSLSPDSRMQVNGRSLDTATPNGPNASHCDTDNKIVMKSRRSIAGEQNDPVEGQDVEDIQRLYETKPEAFRHWLLQRAPSDLLNRLRRQGSRAKQQQENVSSDLFHKWIAFSPTKVSLIDLFIYLFSRRTRSEHILTKLDCWII